MLDILVERTSSLSRFSLDCSSLDGTYEFVAHPTPQLDLNLFGQYKQTNPAARWFSFLILLDNSGRILTERGSYLDTGESREIRGALVSQLVPGNVLLEHPDLKQAKSGVILTPDGPLLVVSRPVLKTNGSGPSRGTLIVGQFFDTHDLKPMENLAGFNLTVRRLDEPDLPKDTQEAITHLPKSGATYVHPADNTTDWGYLRIDDVNGKAALILQAEIPWDSYRIGVISLYYYLGSVIVTGLVFCTAIQLLLEKMVVTPPEQPEPKREGHRGRQRRLGPLDLAGMRRAKRSGHVHQSHARIPRTFTGTRTPH
jgi:sensor domain CHASE-containing protein